jgi:outer membrane protein assembly factor BamB
MQYPVTIALIPCLLAASGGANPPKPAPAPQPAGRAPGDSVLAETLKMNSDAYGRPSAQFRAGHVSRRAAPPTKHTQDGFEVRFPSGAPIVTPAVYKGTVYVSGGFRSREFYAFEANTGKAVWSLDLDDDGPSSPVCGDDVCVFNTESCTVFAVDAATGKQLWAWWLGDPLTSSPTIAGRTLFTSYPAGATGDGKPKPPGATHVLAAFDLRTGKALWQKWLDSDVMSAPVAVGAFLYVTTFSGTIIKLEQATGNVRYALRARATSAPVVHFDHGRESMVFTRRGEHEHGRAEEMIVGTHDNEPRTTFESAPKAADYLDNQVQEKAEYSKKGKANDAANGFSGGAPASANAAPAIGNIGKGSVNTLQAHQGSRVLRIPGAAENVNTMGDEVLATHPETGKTLWSYKVAGDMDRAGGALATAPLYAGGRVVVATLAGTVVTLDSKTGKPGKTFAVGGQVRSQPIVEGGWIYVGTEDGRLVAIDTHDRGLTGWPMWGGDAARTGIAAAQPN